MYALEYYVLGRTSVNMSEAQPPKRLLKVKEVVEELRGRGFDLTERAVRAEIGAKRLRSTKVRNQHYVAAQDLETYIQKRETMPSSSQEGDLALAG